MVTDLIKAILPNTYLKLGLGATLALGLFVGGAAIESRFSTPKVETRVVHDTQQVQVEVPTLSTKVVDLIVTDPKQQELINGLIKENSTLKLKVVSLTSSTATSVSTGSGPVLQSDDSQPGGSGPANSGGLGSNDSGAFNDYQLHAEWDAKLFRYKLTQDFRIVTTTSKDSKGQPVGLVELFQDTPDGQIKIPTETTAIFANPLAPHWLVSPRIQGGLGLDLNKVKSGFIGFQWLKRGRSTDPRDIRWAYLTPGINLGTGSIQASLLPISFNVGSLPKQPFSNVWFSPSLTKSGNLGFTITSTF